MLIWFFARPTVRSFCPRVVLIAMLSILCVPSLTQAQPDLDTVVGSWQGSLATPGGELPLRVEFSARGGSLTGALSAPTRGLEGLPLSDIEVEPDGTLRFRFPADRARWEGQVRPSEDSTVLRGHWFQAGQKIRLDFTKQSDSRQRVLPTGREQTPRPPFPYSTAEVTLETADPAVSLGCTLTTPREEGRHPAAMLLTVAGPNDRDQSHFGHRPFLVLADHLTRRGVVVLRCDDRGVGDSGGDVTAVDLDTLADDAVRGARYLAQQQAVDPAAVGFIGNSEGSLVGAEAALSSPEVGFVVMLGGAGVRGTELIRERRLGDLQRREISESELQSRMALFDRLVELVARGRGAGLEAIRSRDPGLIEEIEEILDSPDFSGGPLFPSERRARLELLLGPWYHSQLLSDAPAVLRQLRQPVLALAGSLDRVNLPAQNLPAIQRALLEGGNQDHTVALLPRLNHVFQTAQAGGMQEYGQLEQSFSPLALRTISDWMLVRFASASE